MHDHTRHRSLIRAVCLDWAGTTVDFGCHGPVEVFATAFRDEGVDVSPNEIRSTMGVGKRDHIRRMLGLKVVADRWNRTHGRPADESDVDRLYARFLPLQVETVRNHAEPIDGVPETMRILNARRISVGTTTGYSREVMDVLRPLAAQHGFAPEVVITVDDVDRGRPAPDQLLACLRELGGVRPEHAIAVDDTAAGIRAGRNAGMWTVGVVTSGNQVGLLPEELEQLRPRRRKRRVELARNQLLAAGAHAVVDLVTELPELVDHFDRRLSAGDSPRQDLP